MSSREPDLRRNSLSALLPGPPVNALPAILQDATRVAPRANFASVQSGSSSSAPAATAERHTMRAQPDLGWFQNMTRDAAQWMEKNKVPSMKEYPPIKLLTAVMGENPMESIDGPAKAISMFAKRSPQIMRMFADAGFENWILKNGPFTPGTGQAVTNSAMSLSRNAPEGVIQDLYNRYRATPAAKMMHESRAADAAAREARAQGRQLHRRASDVPTNALPDLLPQKSPPPLDARTRMQRADVLSPDPPPMRPRGDLDASTEQRLRNARARLQRGREAPNALPEQLLQTEAANALPTRDGPAEWWAAAAAQQTEYELRAAQNRAARAARRDKIR